jgi:hypothetical protein
MLGGENKILILHRSAFDSTPPDAFRISRSIKTLEQFENLFGIPGIDADTISRDGKEPKSVALINAHVDALGSVAKRVADQNLK